MPYRQRTIHRWLAASLCALALAAGPSRADVSAAITPGTLSAAPGSDIDLFVDVTAAGSAFNAFRLVVGFDPAALTPVPLAPTSVQEGCLMKGTCSAACGLTFHDFGAAGDSVVAVDVLLCDLVSVTGPGRLYRLRFHASSTPKATQVRIRRLVFYNAGETVDPVHTSDAQVSIGNAGVDGGGGTLARALRIEPNPAFGRVAFVGQDDRAGWVEAEIVDLQGRVVRALGPVWLGSRERFGWDGTDASGRIAPAGVYEVRIRRGGDHVQSARFVLLR